MKFLLSLNEVISPPSKGQSSGMLSKAHSSQLQEAVGAHMWALVAFSSEAIHLRCPAHSNHGANQCGVLLREGTRGKTGIIFEEVKEDKCNYDGQFPSQ